MKNLLKKLGLTSVFCHYKYHLTAEHVVRETQQNKPPLPLAVGCFIDRNLFWATTRTYTNTNIIELKNIIQAEKKQLPPMEGRFFFSLVEFSSNEFTVTYFIIPESVMALIPEECRVVIPFYTYSQEVSEQPLTISHSQNYDYFNVINKLKWVSLIGLYSKLQKHDKKPEKLNNKKLLIAVTAMLGIVAVSLSAYFLVAINYYQDKKLQNEANVNLVLMQRQKYISQLEKTSGFINFLKINPNVLNKLSKIDIDTKGVFIERVRLVTTGMEIFGTSENSATSILEQIIQSDTVKEAKFSRAVTKDRNGLEAFTIEVTWK